MTMSTKMSRSNPDALSQGTQELDERARAMRTIYDPDLRLARAMHPWIVIGDNHDVAGGPDNDFDGSFKLPGGADGQVRQHGRQAYRS